MNITPPVETLSIIRKDPTNRRIMPKKQSAIPTTIRVVAMFLLKLSTQGSQPKIKASELSLG